jgi:hypothetical protein
VVQKSLLRTTETAFHKYGDRRGLGGTVNRRISPYLGQKNMEATYKIVKEIYLERSDFRKEI